MTDKDEDLSPAEIVDCFKPIIEADLVFAPSNTPGNQVLKSRWRFDLENSYMDLEWDKLIEHASKEKAFICIRLCRSRK